MKKSTYFIIVLTLVMGLNGIVLADFDPNEVVSSMNTFLIRQMEVFDSVRPPGQPPLVQTFGWNIALSFPPPELSPPPCCNLHCAPTPMEQEPWKMVYRGDIYDQSLTALWFTERARFDFTNGRNGIENFTRAQRLLDTVILLKEHDPYADGRIRAVYWANSPLTGTNASIMDPSVGVGNMAYFGIALTRFYHVAKITDYLGSLEKQVYLDVAEEIANWILDHCNDEWDCGFTGGYEGWGQTPFTWKSTEHNIDIFVFATNLYHLTGNQKWNEMAQSAQCLVQRLYVEVDDQFGYYLTGTSTDGNTPNLSPIPTDAQAWTALARCDNLKIDTNERANCAMRWLLANLKDSCECYILSDDGVKFSDVGKNMQCEVTASTVSALLWINEEPNQAQAWIELLDWVRANSAPPYDGIEDGNGVVATPCPEGAYTGYGDAWYYKLLHVASSAWTGFAVMVLEGDEMANPLMPLGCNNAPVANAGGPYNAQATSWDGALVGLNGTDSNDPDEDALTYEWDLDLAVDSDGDGDPNNDVDANEPNPQMLFPIGQTEISLVVTDEYGLKSEPDVTTVTVSLIQVDIDIKPGSLPNSINMGSHGVIPVAFLTDEVFDASTIDPATVTLRGEDFSDGLVKLRGKKDAPVPMSNLEDVDDDGDLDLVVHLETEKLTEYELETVCELGALTYDGFVISGSDTIQIVPE